MKRLLIIIVLLFAALLGIAGWWLLRIPSVSISDTRQPQTIVLEKPSSGGNVYYFEVYGSGEINGSATITMLANGQPYHVANLAGKVDFKWYGDWYSDTIEIRYQPTKVQSGKINLRYRLKTF